LTEVAPGRGRKPSISAERIKAIVEATLHTTPPGATHWSCRTMARTQGVSPATVQRIWDAHALAPHRVRTFKLSRDPRFVQKLTDVVGLYLNPPDKAIVLCVGEKSQIQALDRTQPSLPMKKGRAGTMTDDTAPTAIRPCQLGWGDTPTSCCGARLDGRAPVRSSAVAPGVVGNERAVVMLSDGVEGVGQDASRRLLARSTSLVDSSSAVRSSRAIEPSAR
jgi:hypothetical protein